MALDSEFTRESINQLLAIGRITDDQTEELKAALSETGNRIDSPETILATTLSVIGDFNVASVLVEQVLSLNRICRGIGEAVKQFLDSELSALTDSAENKPDAPLIKQAIQVLGELAELDAVSRTSKAIELRYDCDNVLHQTRVMTDIRPLFSQDAESIQGAVVSHTLRIHYYTGNEDREMSLAVDENDLRKLISDCERALIKGNTATKHICDTVGLPALQVGGNDDQV